MVVLCSQRGLYVSYVAVRTSFSAKAGSKVLVSCFYRSAMARTSNVLDSNLLYSGSGILYIDTIMVSSSLLARYHDHFQKRESRLRMVYTA